MPVLIDVTNNKNAREQCNQINILASYLFTVSIVKQHKRAKRGDVKRERRLIIVYQGTPLQKESSQSTKSLLR